MDSHQMTPPQATVEVEDFDFQYTGGSTSTVSTFFPHDWSPQSVMTAASTPDKSPLKVRETGPMLLPRVRAQDQIMGLGPDLVPMGHTRSTSLASNDFPMQFGGRLPTPQREQEQYINNAMFSMSSSSLAVPSHPSMAIEIAATSRPSMAHMRSRSASHVRSHSRNSSSSSIDASMLNRYGYPTYRQSPTPQPVGMVTPMSRTPSAMSFLAPIGGHVQSYPARRRTASPPANPSRLSVEINEPTDLSLDIEESSLLDYLTKSNPTPSLTRRTVEPRPSSRTDFWFDVRNVRSWSDFNMDTIAALPSFLDLLKVGVSARALPAPAQVNLSPETPAHLAELCAKHHAVKVNAALKVAQGDKHIVIRALASTSAGARQQPNFVASYQSDAEKTIYGDGRGRVVGIVRCFDQWHSGMRNESALHKINYLRALAHLHRCMREHGCRYGFIMTEIELVCVRAGGPVSEDSQVPLFGYLEIATPIQMSTSGLATDGELQMTADLALWYLHMLAKEEPLPGQYTWRMDVGGAAARSRSHHLPQDGWIPTVHQVDKREAKRARGWVFPNEPLSKREVGKKRQSTKS